VLALFCAGVLVSFGVVLFGTHNLVTGAITLNLLIAVNYKPGRYQAYIESKKAKNIDKDATLEEELLGVVE
jgi:hypothetical protein